VLFVCTANICRSPIAEAIFDSLASEASLPWKARSAGVAALVGETIAPRAEAVLKELGVSKEGHRARQVDEAMLEEASLVLAMTPQHAATLDRLSASSSAKVHTLVGYAQGVPASEGILDPYGQSVAAHRAVVRQILYHLRFVVERLGG
jgi:protein-tyrosine phosphatase